MSELIILSPCKEMDHTPGNLPIQIGEYSQQLVDYFAKQSLEDIATFFKVSDHLAQDILQYYQSFSIDSGRPAWQVYQGLAFRQIQWESIDLSYAQKHLRILSALYGPIGPLEAIHPYRLDFMRSFQWRGQSLKKSWQATYLPSFQGHTIYDLASQEFSSLIPKKDAHVIQIDFSQSYPNKKAPAAVAKKLRGALASHLLSHQSFHEETFADFVFEAYCLVNFRPEDGIIHFAKHT